MRIAALYDIHGNLPALEAVLTEVRQAEVDRIVVGGDVVPGPMPCETLDCLRALDIPAEFIRGNGEIAVLAQRAGRDPGKMPEQARAAVRWVGEQLRPADERQLASWPATLRVAVSGLGEVLFCHATPRSDNEIFTRSTPERVLAPIFRDVDVAWVVCGHTHMQFDRTVGDTRVVNAGSVGMPFGEPGAYWLLLDSDAPLRRTAYDLVAAARRIASTAYPGASEFAQRNVLRPPSEAEMLELYANAELRE